jgi:membrane protein implicated in regulation of membrane protease activity
VNTGSDRLQRRRCIGFRVAFIFGILLAVINRGSWTLLSIALAGLAVLVIAYWRDCRKPRHTP